ncbi:MAG: HD domain-containing protein [Desulfuromonadaceae bacterium]|nr:HD domain-containing protein [Desulfuromonadaceae bacterium]
MSDAKGEIKVLLNTHFSYQAPELSELVEAVAALYHSGTEDWQACQVAYHDFRHVGQVTLLALRLLAGCARAGQQALCGPGAVRRLTAAALLHDSGYLKRRGEAGGRGGEHSFDHVGRSEQLAQHFLLQKGWVKEDCETVQRLIGQTEIIHRPTPVMGELESELASFLRTADLLAQVAAVDYVERLPDLYDEFAEAYQAVGVELLRRRGVPVFESLAALVSSSASFMRQQVLPELKDMGCMDRCLPMFYGTVSTPYHRQLEANLQRLERLEGEPPISSRSA